MAPAAFPLFSGLVSRLAGSALRREELKDFPLQRLTLLPSEMHPNLLFSFNYLSVTNLAEKPIKRVGD